MLEEAVSDWMQYEMPSQARLCAPPPVLDGRRAAGESLLEEAVSDWMLYAINPTLTLTLPKLCAPPPAPDGRRAAGESLLEEAVAMAARSGLVRANDHIVVVQMLASAFVVKIVSVDEAGYGIQAIRPKSLVDLMMARPPAQGPLPRV